MPHPPDILADLASRLRGPLRRLLSPDTPLHLRSAPARLDVLGGLASEAGGTLAQMPLPHRAAVAAQLRTDSQLIIHSTTIAAPSADPDVALPLSSLIHQNQMIPPKNLPTLLSPTQTWAFPLVALYYVLLQTASKTTTPSALEPRTFTLQHFQGATLILHSTIAPGAGQASSTAIITAALVALSDAANIQMDPLDLALIVHRAESLPGSSNANVVDAMTCLMALDASRSPPPAIPLAAPLGTRTVATTTLSPRSPKSAAAHASNGNATYILRYSAQPHQLVGQVKIPKDLRILALDTGVRYSAAAATVDALRLAGAMGLRITETIYRDLGQRHTPLHGHLANLSPALYRQYFRALLPRRMRGSDFLRSFGPLPERAGTITPTKMYRVRAAVDHLITEHEHAENFLQAMEELSDPARRKHLSPSEEELILRRAGRLVLASHHSYRLRLELSCREADWLVDSLMESGPDHGIYGARITGSGGGGTVVAVLNRSPKATEAFLKTFSGYSQIASRPLTVLEAGALPSAGTLHSPALTLPAP